MDALINILLSAAFVGCVIWAAVAPGMQALIPTIIAIAAGIGLLSRKTDYIKYF